MSLDIRRDIKEHHTEKKIHLEMYLNLEILQKHTKQILVNFKGER